MVRAHVVTSRGGGFGDAKASKSLLAPQLPSKTAELLIAPCAATCSLLLQST